MIILHFYFHAGYGSNWTMEKACCATDTEDGDNPAPESNPCVYLIHNENTNNTYAGFADNAKKRWGTRTEAFHCMGIKADYAKKVLCAYCYPQLEDTVSGVVLPHPGPLKGQDNPEHLLIRAVVNGLLGKTTSTNTKSGKTLCKKPVNINRIQISLPTDPWGKLESEKFIDLPQLY